ncbi:arginase family protein [Asanoa siamensis]|uniref:Arginase n=1 Tax=Asanoa siamensis TaxID=926357 RepID=A0ABQ4CXT6_9ACTN|nr:arginase family protein [Asanoa siamensis]GIF76111.1 hypothetical protein Asi02nite_56290 [Asanoa siamensis]
MVTFHVPWHQDERLTDESIPLPAGAVTVVPVLPAGTTWERLRALHDAVAERVAHQITDGDVPTVVSGDCLVALGTLAGVQRAGFDPGIVWFDAHGDVHTLDTTTSGYLGGLSLRLALGAHPDLAVNRPVDVDRALLVGARDLDPAEITYLDGATAPATRTVEDLGTLPDGPLVLHVDLDVIDAGALPGLRFPAPGGPSAAAVRAAMDEVLRTGRVAAIDLACPWHPAPSPQTQAERQDLLAHLTS